MWPFVNWNIRSTFWWNLYENMLILDLIKYIWNCYLQDGSHFSLATLVNTLKPSQNGRHFPDDIFKCTFLNENAWISIKISLKFVPKGPMNKIPALVQIMAWHRSGDEPLSEPMMVSLLMHICVTGSQWVKIIKYCLPIYVTAPQVRILSIIQCPHSHYLLSMFA